MRPVSSEIVAEAVAALEAQHQRVCVEAIADWLGWGSRKLIGRRLRALQRRATDAAALDRAIQRQRARGLGHVEPPRPLPQEEEPMNKEARAKLKTLRLAKSLLDEAVPWLKETSL
jgi:hypothetical protein